MQIRVLHFWPLELGLGGYAPLPHGTQLESHVGHRHSRPRGLRVIYLDNLRRQLSSSPSSGQRFSSLRPHNAPGRGRGEARMNRPLRVCAFCGRC